MAAGRWALIDAYGRPLDNLRVSVTNECNYRCIFCHVEGHPRGAPSTPGSEPPIMTPADYEVVAEASRLVGIRSFKITGGEPLVRRDIVDVVAALRSGHRGSEISMTTNGYLLAKYALPLVEAGLNRVNVSIHSLRREVYRFITGVDGLERALKGLEAAWQAGLGLKINMVVLRGVNEEEFWDLARLAARYSAVLQVIELHPVGLGARLFKGYYTPLDRLEGVLAEKAVRVERRSLHNRPVYVLPDGTRVEVVRPYGNPFFCAGCSRVRLLPEGKLSPCLNWRGPLVDLLGRIRSRTTREERVEAAVKALVEVNTLRRPFFLWRIGLEPPWGARGGGPRRLSLPKRRAARALANLRPVL